VGGDSTVPADAVAVVLNVSVVDPSAKGYLTVYPTGATRPVTSNVNYAAGQVVPNLVEVGAGTNGQVSIYSSAGTDLVVDLEGYVAPASAGSGPAGLYHPLATPARLCDTRAGNPSGLSGDDLQCSGGAGNPGQRLTGGGSISVKVATDNGLPGGATAAVLNVTAVNPAGNGYLTVLPQGGTRPVTANVNYTSGTVANNRVIVALSIGGSTPGEVTIYWLFGNERGLPAQPTECSR
jgi:hypothetical protein